MWAASRGHFEVVKLLLEKGANVNAKQPDDGRTALIWAAETGHSEVIRLLLEKGADVNAKQMRFDFTALMEASMRGDAESVKLLLEKGADVNAKDYSGNTALGMAKQRSLAEIVQLLEKAGAKE
jgi:ankyrin repeat protein